MDGYFYIHVLSNQNWHRILKVTKGEVSELKFSIPSIVTLNNSENNYLQMLFSVQDSLLQIQSV